MKTIAKLLSFVLFSFLFLHSVKSVKAQCHIDDWTALKAIYESTNGDNWINRAGWDIQIDNQTVPPVDCHLSNLFGVSTNGQGRVGCIDLDGEDNCGSDFAGNNLNGSLPNEIGQLAELTYLVLNNNNLNGQLPPQIGQLSSLVWLSLHNNEFSGSIPNEIGNLSNVKNLGLSEKYFNR